MPAYLNAELLTHIIVLFLEFRSQTVVFSLFTSAVLLRFLTHDYLFLQSWHFIIYITSQHLCGLSYMKWNRAIRSRYHYSYCTEAMIWKYWMRLVTRTRPLYRELLTLCLRADNNDVFRGKRTSCTCVALIKHQVIISIKNWEKANFSQRPSLKWQM